MSVPLPTGSPQNSSNPRRGKDQWGNTVWYFFDKPIRVDDSGPEPKFCLIDCMTANGLSKQHGARYKEGLSKFNTPGGHQYLAVISEEGFYRLSLRGHKPISEEFRSQMACVAREMRKRADGEAIDPPAQVKPNSSIEALIQMSTVITQSLVELAGVKAIAVEAQHIAEDVRDRIAKLETRSSIAENHLKSLPPPKVQAPEKSPCDVAEQRVRFWCKQEHAEYRDAWLRLYEEFRRRCNIDARRRQVNDPKKYPRILDVVRELAPELQEQFYAIASEIFPLDPKLQEGS